MREWQEESVLNRAKCVAHVLHKNLRESYDTENRLGNTDKKGKGRPETAGQMRDFLSEMH
jgi:hypothetical protein